jgi:hypothetical protein
MKSCLCNRYAAIKSLSEAQGAGSETRIIYCEALFDGRKQIGASEILSHKSATGWPF